MVAAEANPVPPERPGEQPVAESGGSLIGFLLTLVLSGFAIWYGWKYGNEYAPWFWRKIQMYGIALGKLFESAPSASSLGKRFFENRPTTASLGRKFLGVRPRV